MLSGQRRELRGGRAALLTLDAGALHPAVRAGHARGQLREGLAYVRERPAILAPLLMRTLIGTFTYEFGVTLPLVASDTFRGGPDAYSRLVRAAAAFGAATCAAALAPTFAIELAMLAVAGAASVIFLTTGNSTAQLADAPRYRGAAVLVGRALLRREAPEPAARG